MKMRESDDLVSIITPTYERPQFLEQLWLCIVAQTWNNIEWLVGDDSPIRCEFMWNLANMTGWKVRYFHNGIVRQTIGQKRNELIAQAEGHYIVHFDDDDYYAPHYITQMLAFMKRNDAEFCKLSSFFLYYSGVRCGAYWDLLVKEGIHFRRTEQGLIPIAVTEQNNAELRNMHMGFGFSYVYKRKVWQRHRYRHINMHEDEYFIQAAGTTTRIELVPDTEGLCWHTIHGLNTSQCFPQCVFPGFMLKIIFPGATDLVLDGDTNGSRLGV